MDFDFSSVNVLVVGDVMLDRYVEGRVLRVSPEAPVPVVEKEKEWSVLGGAANTAANISSLGANCTLAGMIGCDTFGTQVRKLLIERKIKDKLFQSVLCPTTVKTRVIGNFQQLLRIDNEQEFQWCSKNSSIFLLELFDTFSDYQAIVLSDYGKGFLSEEVCKAVIEKASSLKIPVLVDPKDGDWSKYEGSFCIKPNHYELSKQCDKEPHFLFENDDEAKRACQWVFVRNNVRHVFLTRGSKGSFLLQEDGSICNFPAEVVEVSDVSGAGDTAMATFAVFVAKNYPLPVAAYYATKSASFVVTKRGTYAIKLSDLRTLRAEKEL